MKAAQRGRRGASGADDQAAPDPLRGRRFDRLYKSLIEPQLVALEQKRNHALRLQLGIYAIGAVVLLAEFLILHDLQVLLFTFVALGFVAYVPLDRVGRAWKTSVMNALCAPLDILYVESKFAPPALDAFVSLHLLPRPDAKSFHDSFSGRHGDVDFTCCRAWIREHFSPSNDSDFSGELIRLVAPDPWLGTTVVLRDAGWLNRFKCPAGLKKIGLEDPEFEGLFEVFGSDQVEARAILTPTFMERLIALDHAYASTGLRCAFLGGDVLIAVKTPLRLDVADLSSSLIDRGQVQVRVRSIEAMFDLVDALRVG